jgi:surface polysaccharide O-acyltransferase-like enzyme
MSLEMKRSGTSLALSNLRAVVILIVVAVHSVLAYLEYATPSQQFDKAPYHWLVTPIVDTQRWLGFDLFCAWQDVYLMSLLFFLSGCFVWTSLERKGSWQFLRDRLVRIGIPFVIAVAFLMPIALFPVYLRTAADPTLTGYWHAWRNLPFWPCGPQWFLGVLLMLNIVAAAIHRVKRAGAQLGMFSYGMRQSPVAFVIVVAIVSTFVYVPLALAFTPWHWLSFGPFSFQLSRPLLYFVYFFAGVSAGAAGLDRGFLKTDGVLARHWLSLCIMATLSFVVWISLTALIMPSGSAAPLLLQILNDIAFGLSCATSCFLLISLFLRFGQYHAWWSDSLSENAYGIYVVHYVFVVWAQYMLVDNQTPAFIKAAMVFVTTVCASWLVSAGVSAFWNNGRTKQIKPKTL